MDFIFMKIIQALVVEDHPMAQEMAAHVLQSLNCEVDVADTGEIALLKTQNKTYDLIFIDLTLPNIDGYAVSRKIREHEKTARHATIVALTSSDYDTEKAQAIASGMDDFYGKPLTIQMAQKIINQFINNT